MDMRAGRIAGTADGSDNLTLSDQLTDRDTHSRHMSIDRLRTVRVTDGDIEAVSAVVASGSSDNYFTVCRSHDGRTCWSGKVNGVIAMDTLTLPSADYRTQIVAGVSWET